MIAAIYARKSTDQPRITDDQKSVVRQIETCRAYALRKGYVVSDEWIVADDGISGAEFTRRPGLRHLMNCLRPRPPFQVLIMTEESRLGREALDCTTREVKFFSQLSQPTPRTCHDSLRH